MLREDEWEYFRGYTSKGVATTVAQQLELDGVPNFIHTPTLDGGVEPEYWILVQCSLAHRARWIRSQLPPDENELAYLATKKLSEAP